LHYNNQCIRVSYKGGARILTMAVQHEYCPDRLATVPSHRQADAPNLQAGEKKGSCVPIRGGQATAGAGQSGQYTHER